MTNRRAGLVTVLLAFTVLAGTSLRGQAPPPPPPAPATAARPAVAAPTATATLPPPPLPISTPVDTLPMFDVASVKKQTGNVTSMTLRTPGGGRITVVNLPLRTLMTQAFGVRDTQIIGGPSWLTSDRFIINAKAATNAPRDQLMLMLRSLLIERFGLKFHVEKRDAQSYVLTAPPGWKPNSRIQPIDCSSPTAAGARGDAPPAAAAPRTTMPPCGNLSLSNNVITARGLTFASFASLLGSLGSLGQVQDRTNIPGTFNFQIEASILLGRSLSMISSLSAAGGSPLTGTTADLLPTIAEGPSLTEAVKTLGLELVRRSESIEVLVIDSINQPDED